MAPTYSKATKPSRPPATPKDNGIAIFVGAAAAALEALEAALLALDLADELGLVAIVLPLLPVSAADEPLSLVLAPPLPVVMLMAALLTAWE